MPSSVADRVVQARPDLVWAVVADVALYAQLATGLSHVEILEGDGQGLRRRCYDTRGRGWNETCTVWEPGRRFQMRVDTAWMDQHLADDVVWHVGGNSKWAGAYEGKAKVLEYFGRQAQATGGPPTAEIHDIVGNDEHVVVLGSAKATARDGSSAEWKYTQIFHIRDGKTTEVWGMAENDAAVDPFLDGLPG
jgi:ketosteroid isomerase-like protein